ncbi:TonB family protein [Pseudoxanthomonas wuyuanensis]|uniref:Protein TonB n=1 Tax=Pseudoxanthomonas wuyuanensis TaxID=1073196 RepID=A0A286D5Y9_9GAMM|nr:TonB family protein [Pseudoxanthomonas wuyuanensis]KAF1721573.1 energy transducer TonB [Pseudoxanthomonas wuyuanensis]SOD54068.1 protein TonB [Pseudoxanthomonas wuyuanensis]
MKTYRIRRAPALSFCLLALGACGRHDTPATGPLPPAAAAAPAAVDHLDQLRQRAQQAMRDNRLYAPDGDNAIEYFLAARERQPDDTRTHAALIELQPYLLIATEQMLERGEREQAQRLLQLLMRVDAQAPALPRLQAALEQLQRSPAAPQTDVAADIRAGDASVVAVKTAAAAAAASLPALPTPIPEAETVPPLPPPAPATALVPPAPAAEVPRPAPAPVGTAAALPRLLQDAQPRYPLPALRGRIEGAVEVAFDIQPDGSVRNARMLSATPEGVFDAAALAVASRWRFEPSGQSHRSQRTVRFRLPD